MPELRVGFNYHLAEARKVQRLASGENFAWRATCDACGWYGPVWVIKSDAEEDAHAHDTAENN